jgi:crotonobetainyl-CoA:carnitine CoA-transferase CaiB-like acyl-CoA transferase
MTDTASGPLSGLRVLDVSIMAAGPWTGALLGMLGAEVIKVEPPAGDGTRWVMPTQRGMGTNFISMNVNKKDITLDFKNPDDAALARALAARSDIFVQNFRPGVIERLGLDYPTLRTINPRLVYCAISGFGEIGPLAREACADPIMQAFSGFACANGAPSDTVEAFRFTGFIDLATASVACEAILAALHEREARGRGQKVEVSMLEAALEMQVTRIAELLGAGQVPVARGSEGPMLAPDRAYRAQDRWVFVTVHRDGEWARLCRALELDGVATDPRFATNRDRVAHRVAIDAILEPIFVTRPATWWLRLLGRNGVVCGIAHEFETFRHHRQIVENGMAATIFRPEWGRVTVAGVPWNFSATPCKVTATPLPDMDGDAIRAFVATAMPVAAEG